MAFYFCWSFCFINYFVVPFLSYFEGLTFLLFSFVFYTFLGSLFTSLLGINASNILFLNPLTCDFNYKIFSANNTFTV